MLGNAELRFLEAHPVARLATADRHGAPHVVPVCYVADARSVHITVDGKPKSRGARGLKRERNIRENPAVALVVDHYEDDWSRLGWVMVRGRAEILEAGGAEHAAAQARLAARYPRLREMDIGRLPVIAIRIDRVGHWGKLD